jgi:RNA polymerase sigma factor (sigma-70 family)
MTDRLGEFRDLMRHARDGSQEAARLLFERYGAVLLRAVRSKLHPRLRAQFDSIDFVQDVWASFFADAVRDRDFDSPAALAGFLEQMARNKVIDAGRQQRGTQKRDLDRQRSLADAGAARAADVARPQPTPSQFVMAEEEWERLLAQAPEHHRRILVLLRQGHTHAEVAQKLGTTTKTIQRLLRHICPGLVS